MSDDSAVEREVARPSKWFRQVQKGENETTICSWKINKENIYNNYAKKFIKSFDSNDNEILDKEYKKNSDKVIINPEQVLVLPNGKVITPIRQYCEVKVLPTDTDEAFFYNFRNTRVEDIETTPNINAIITKKSAKLKEKGTRLEINTETDNSPIDIIAAANRSFSLESISDETKIIFDAVKNNKNVITIDGGTHMTYETVLRARETLEETGIDCSNLVMYTSAKAIRDLTLDPTLDTYIGFSKPTIITEASIERLCGVNLVRTSKSLGSKIIELEETFWGKVKRIILFRKKPTKSIPQYTSILFVPNVTFGLVVGEELDMKAINKRKEQLISLTGTQRSAAIVKNADMCIKIIHSG